MPWSIKLGRIFGIDIKMHVTFLLILVWGAFAYGGSAGPLYGLLVTVSLFTLVLLHELGHSLAALGFGIGVRDITLLPIGGVARLERMPEKPLQELVIALAGPLVNVLLAVGLLPVVGGLGLLQGEGFSLRLFTHQVGKSTSWWDFGLFLVGGLLISLVVVAGVGATRDLLPQVVE